MIIPIPCRLILAAGAALLVSACDRETVQVYNAPRDTPAAQPAEEHSPDDGHDHGPAAPSQREMPQMAWTLPAGWEQVTGSQMNAATFSIKNDKGEGTVTITPLPNLAGREEMVVNMWRQQVGQEPLSADQVSNALTDVEVAGGKGKLFEIDGNREGKALKILTAMQHGQSNASWFYKLSGDAALVSDQKPAFLAFVKSVMFKEPTGSPAPASAAPTAPTPTAATPAAPAAEEAPAFKWTIPEGWQQVAPGQMQAAKFTVPDKDGAKAEVAVSVFPSDTGGTLANVNRWLGQIGQIPVTEADLGKYVKPLEGGPEGGQLVDLPGEDKRMIGAIVPRDGRWWFYKLTGGAPAVNAARDAFVAFAKAQP